MPRKKKSVFQKARSTEVEYVRSLRSVAREVGKIVNKFFPNGAGTDTHSLNAALEKYSSVLTPWAKSKAATMVEQSNRQDLRAWKSATKEMSLGIRQAITSTPVGQTFSVLMDEQVTLIKSLPLKAAERVHKLVTENLETSGRAKEIADEIKRSGKVTASRATLIARTEVARASSVLTQSRARHVGSQGYIWRTVHDSDVRKSHKKMDGKFVSWDSPPTLDGLTGHAGQLPNCRCFADPVIPEELFDD